MSAPEPSASPGYDWHGVGGGAPEHHIELGKAESEPVGLVDENTVGLVTECL
jgi:hypothetical protein